MRFSLRECQGQRCLLPVIEDEMTHCDVQKNKEKETKKTVERERECNEHNYWINPTCWTKNVGTPSVGAGDGEDVGACDGENVGA